MIGNSVGDNKPIYSKNYSKIATRLKINIIYKKYWMSVDNIIEKEIFVVKL